MAKPTTPIDAKDELALMTRLWAADIKDDPLAFVMFAYPWGEPGTPLEHHKGPRKWQADILNEIKQQIADNRNKQLLDLNPKVLQAATASGRGIGKSSLTSWLVHWMMSTRLGSTTIVTANTEQQLKSRTWAELGKWVTLAINGHWFDMTALSMRPAKWFEESLKKELKIDTGYYYAQAQLWSEENPDAFAGVHNHNGILVLFDEASGIPHPIWTVTEGFFTEPIVDRYWFVFSNPRRNSGAFFEAFHKNRNFWHLRKIDARTVEGTDKALYEKIIAQHGFDSYEACVEVRGEFPSQSVAQFIPVTTAQAAMERHVDFDAGAPLVMGVDVARFGDDRSVIAFRQGRDARSIQWQFYAGIDTMQLAMRVAEYADKYRPEAIFVDGGGVGGGVVDRLKELKYRVIEVQAGESADDKDKYANKRVEMWDRMREWMLHAAIPHSDELFNDLIGIEYKYNVTTTQLMLERKDEMKKRGLASPDLADALALTFARPVARRDVRHSYGSSRTRFATGREYAILG